MPCVTMILRQVPFFALFDDDELTVLAWQVELRTFAPGSASTRSVTRGREGVCAAVRHRASMALERQSRRRRGPTSLPKDPQGL